MQNNYYINGKLKDYYDILQVDRNADRKTISIAYKSLAKRNHPDLGGSTKMMQIINEAYNELKDEDRKRVYDILYDQYKNKKNINKKYNEENYNSENNKKKEAEYRYKETNYEYSRKDTFEKRKAKAKEQNNSDYVFLVTVFSEQYEIPQICPCCLEEATKNFDVKYKWSEYNITHNKEIKVTFPICNACISHNKEVNKKGSLATISGCIINAVVSLILKIMFEFSWGELMTVGIITSIISVIVLKSIIKISTLDEKHACRCEPVRIHSHDSAGMIFEFYNWLYAEQFAKANKSELIKVKKAKDLRASKKFDGKILKQITISCLILMIIINTIISIFVKS